MNPPVFTDYASLFAEVSKVGWRLAEMGAAEGGAGNLSVALGPGAPIFEGFSRRETVPLRLAVPELAGVTLLVTGSGVRMRELRDEPQAQMGCLVVAPGGERAELLTVERPRFERLTSELVAHLAIHQQKMPSESGPVSVVVHAQPRQLTFLSHLPEYQDPGTLEGRLLRWQPEMILQFPAGVGAVPFRAPSSMELMELTRSAFLGRRAVVWTKHGVVTYSNRSLTEALDAIEYLETAACYECLDLATGQRAPGLTAQEIRSVADAYGVVTATR